MTKKPTKSKVRKAASSAKSSKAKETIKKPVALATKPANQKKKPSSKQSIATAKKKVASKKYAGWEEFHDNGAALLSNVVATGTELAVGTSKTALQMRLRPASNHPDQLKRVRKAHILPFRTARAELDQVRALVEIGVPFVLSAKGSTKVLADRHPAYKHELIDVHLKRIKDVARRAAFKEIATLIETQIARGRSSKHDPEQDNFMKIAKREFGTFEVFLRALRLWVFDTIKQDFATPENFMNMLKKWHTDRGAKAAVTDKTKPRENSLEGHYDD